MAAIESPVLILNPHVTLAQAPETQRPKVNVPDAVRDLFQADIFPDADGGDVHPPAVPPNAAVGADVADFEAIRVLERWQPVRHRPVRRGVAGRRRLLIERLVRALVVELLPKSIEAALLRGEAARRRARGLGLQGAVHAFMPAVLLWAAGLDEFRQDAQADPPRRKLRQAGQRGGGKRHAVVSANPRRQPILPEQPREDRFGLVDGRRAQRLTAQEITAEAVRHRQRIAVPPIARPELALVVGAPEVVGRENLARRLAGMPQASALASDGDHPMPTQDVARCGTAREHPAGMAPVQQREQLLAAPARVPTPGVEDRGHDLLGGVPRRALWPARALFQPGRPVAQVAVDPFVARLAGYPVELAQLGDRQRVPQMVGDELRSLVHG